MAANLHPTNNCTLLFAQMATMKALMLDQKYAVNESTNQDGATHVNYGTPDRCRAATGSYSLWLHILTIFVILAASFIGTIIPVIGKFIPKLQLPPFPMIMAKSASTGVLLSVALIHLINEAADAFRLDCVPVNFRESYGAYALLFSMISALLMHALDLELDTVLQRWAEGQKKESSPSLDTIDKHTGDEEPGYDVRICGTNEEVCQDHCDDPVHHHHSHAVACPSKSSAAKRIAAAIFMEFGVTLHSVFVGLAVGVANDADTKVLLVALVFHQMFEGLALGSRLADASMHMAKDLVFAVVFSVSAPLGTAIGVGVVVGMGGSVGGTTLVMVRGVADSVCGGIMMYLGFGLLFSDFAADVREHGGPDVAHRGWKRMAMYGSLWLGAGVMAAIGKWV